MLLRFRDDAAVIDALHANEPDGWRKNRLLAIKLAAGTKSTSAGIADICGGAGGQLIKGIKAFRECSLEVLLARDQASFHLRDGGPRPPASVRIIDLPYSPERSPCEQPWDIVKDDIGNRVFETIEALREARLPTLQR